MVIIGSPPSLPNTTVVYGQEENRRRGNYMDRMNPTSSSHDNHHHQSHYSMVDQSKCLESSECLGRDSGFLSGTCATESEIDVGGGSSSSYQRLDSGVDLALSVSGLSLSGSGSAGQTDHHRVIQFPHLNPTDNEEYAQHWQEYFQQDDDGDTQLHIGIIQEFVESVFTLISLVPRPTVLDCQNDAAQTPLHLAVLTKQSQVVRRLVAAGAQVDMRDKFGNTPLHLAAASGDLGSVQCLTKPISPVETIQCGLRYSLLFPQQSPMPPFLPQQLDLLNYEGQGPIHLAAIGGHTEVVRNLCHFGANIELKDGKGGRTALHFAVERGHTATAQILISECGADIESITYGGLTPYQFAAESHPHLARELLRLGATIPSSHQPMEEDDYSSSDSSDSESDVP